MKSYFYVNKKLYLILFFFLFLGCTNKEFFINKNIFLKNQTIILNKQSKIDIINSRYIINNDYKNFFISLEKTNLLKKISKTNGNLMWEIILPNHVLLKPIIYQNKILIFLKNNFLLILNLQNGNIIYKKKIHIKISSLPIIDKQMIFINSLNNNIYVFDLIKYKLIWHYKNFIILNNIIFFKKIFFIINKQYVISYFINGKLICFNKFTGLINWMKKLKSNLFIKKKYIFIKQDILYISNTQNSLLAININSGKEIFQLNLKYLIKYIHAINNSLLIFQKNSVIKCFNNSNGTFLWENKLFYNRDIILKNIILNKIYLLDNNKYTYFICNKNGKTISMKKII